MPQVLNCDKGIVEEQMNDQIPPGLGQVVKRPRFNLPSSNQDVAGNGDSAVSGGEERKQELQDNVNEIWSGPSGSGNDDGNRARDEGEAASAGEEKGGQDSPPNPFGYRVWEVIDGWVVFATHPQRGRFEINEGVVLVGDRYVNASLPIPPHTVTFPQLDMLNPVIGRIAIEVASIANAGYSEVNPPPNGPNTETEMGHGEF
ncbi:hypothetical protein MKX03_015734 [Papaver bracteatum]|nr:hypothetical protein MKX03_015734 [Papaver bracteatum]